MRAEVLEALDQARAGGRMRPDLRELVISQRAGLAQHTGIDGDLADVVQRSAEPERVEALAPPPELRARLSAIAVTRVEWPRRYGSLASRAAERVASSDPTVPDFPARVPVPFLTVVPAS